MGTYVVTGSASGMGRAAAERLRSAGHSVIGVDIKDADVRADLSTAQGRRAASEAVLQRCSGALDGAVLAAGLGPVPGRDHLIAQVNYFGVVDLLTALRSALGRTGERRSSSSPATRPRSLRWCRGAQSERYWPATPSGRCVRFVGSGSVRHR